MWTRNSWRRNSPSKRPWNSWGITVRTKRKDWLFYRWSYSVPEYSRARFRFRDRHSRCCFWRLRVWVKLCAPYICRSWPLPSDSGAFRFWLLRFIRFRVCSVGWHIWGLDSSEGGYSWVPLSILMKLEVTVLELGRWSSSSACGDFHRSFRQFTPWLLCLNGFGAISSFLRHFW